MAFLQDSRKSSLCALVFMPTIVFIPHSALRKTASGKPNSLFISYVKPHKAVTTATVARWIRWFLMESGVYMSTFKTHSVKGAATWAAANAFVPV